MPKFIDRAGTTYSRLTYIRRVGRNKHKQVLWEAQCSCGNICVVLSARDVESCGKCGLLAERNSGPKPHSPEHCRKISEAKRIKDTEHLCPVCGKTFMGTKLQRFCSVHPCQKAFFDSRCGFSRAKALTLQFGSKYTYVAFWKVYERDGGICQVCHTLAPRELRGNPKAPLAPSLGHIIPLSRGGDHTYENTQLEHLGCNLLKGNDLPEGVVEPRINPDPRTRVEKIREETRKAMQRPEVRAKMLLGMAGRSARRKSQSAITSPTSIDVPQHFRRHTLPPS